MAKLTRVPAKVFAASAAATEIGQFGSAVAGSKLETSDVATIQGLSAWLDGWSEALVSGNRYPALQEMNGLLKVLSYQGAYTLQEGIPEYDSATTYYIGSIVKKTGTFELYGSLTNDNVGNALSVKAAWKFLVDLADSTRAIELRNLIKSCKLDNNGDCDLLSYSGSDVTVQSSSDNPLIYVNPNGTTSTVTSQNSLDFSSGYADTKYPLIQLSDGTVDVTASYTEARKEPTSPANNDYWLNTSVIPNTLQKYEVSEWIEKQGVFIGSVNVASNLVAGVEQPVIRNIQSVVSGGSCMPSGKKYIDLTLGASGSSYTAPANGWVFLTKRATATDQYLYLKNSTGRLSIGGFSTVVGYDTNVYLPIQKNDIFSADYSMAGITTNFRFIYAEGEI